MTSVPDGSLLTRAFARSQFRSEAFAAVEELARSADPLVAPSLLPIEFASTLRQLEMRGSLLRPEAIEAWRLFRELRITFAFEISWVERASAIATAAGLSKIYDATYLACAEALDAELVTCDEKFAASLPAALRSRVRLVAASA